MGPVGVLDGFIGRQRRESARPVASGIDPLARRLAWIPGELRELTLHQAGGFGSVCDIRTRPLGGAVQAYSPQPCEHLIGRLRGNTSSRPRLFYVLVDLIARTTAHAPAMLIARCLGSYCIDSARVIVRR